MYLNVVSKASGMSGLGRRRARVLMMRPRGIGQNTLAQGGLTEADCQSVGTILDVNTVFCMSANYGTPADIAAAAQAVNAQAAAPPVYLSSFVSGNPLSTTSQGVDYVAASVASQVNDQNGRLYAQYQNAISNWVINGSQGTPPAPPQYVTFQQYWAGQNLGPAPASISVAPAGTPIPQSGYDVSGGSTPVYTPMPPTPIVPANPGQSVSGSQQNAPPQQSTPAGSMTFSSGDPLAFATQPVSVFGSSFPVWELAIGGLLAFLLLRKL